MTEIGPDLEAQKKRLDELIVDKAREIAKVSKLGLGMRPELHDNIVARELLVNELVELVNDQDRVILGTKKPEPVAA